MTVLMFNAYQKRHIYDSFVKGDSKASIARSYKVSVRTVGRIIAEVKNTYQQMILESYDDDGYGSEYADEVWDDDTKDDAEVEYTVIATKDSIHINKVTNGEDHENEVISKNHKNFDTVSQIVWSNRGSQESLSQAYKMMNKAQQVLSISDRIKLDTDNHILLVDDIKLPVSLADKFIQITVAGSQVDLDKYTKFSINLTDNVSNSVLNRLYDFISANSVQITDDGMIICFKKVNSEFKDIYSRSFDNSVGKIVQVRRNQVDENINKTCSYGLHVCAAHYLDSYGSDYNNRVVKVLLDPADVVSIPSDYNDSKVRCCSYTVIEDVTEQYRQGELK